MKTYIATITLKIKAEDEAQADRKVDAAIRYGLEETAATYPPEGVDVKKVVMKEAAK